jgi:hypothetical protein
MARLEILLFNASIPLSNHSVVPLAAGEEIFGLGQDPQALKVHERTRTPFRALLSNITRVVLKRDLRGNP